MRLASYLADARGIPFEYGVHDCCLFAAGAVNAMTGDDPIPEFRGRYHNLRSSLRALRDIGEGNLEKTMDAKFPDIDPAHAQRGDLAMFDNSVGVVTGRFAWFASDNDLERVPMALWDRAWRVE